MRMPHCMYLTIIIPMEALPDRFGVRPKCQNNKGLVDMYLREKMACRTVRDIFDED